MDSEPNDASKNICLQQTSCSTKPLHLMCQSGLSVWICRRRLTRSNGKTYGKPSANMEYPIFQRIYYGHTGRIENNNADRDLFYIRGGVRQGCVLSPRLFSCVLEVALGCPWMLASESWHGRRGFSGSPSFCENVSGNQIFVGRTGDMFGRSRFTIECAKNEGIDNSVTKSDRSAALKWTGN